MQEDLQFDSKLASLPRENRILALMLELGPNIPSVSKLSSIPKETVRYLYKEHLLKRRIRIQREIDHEKLGLSYLQFLMRFTPEVDALFDYPTPDNALLGGVWESLYVATIYRIIPDNSRLMIHLAPPAFHPRLRQFYNELEQTGLASVLETYDCPQVRHTRMWVETYDSDRGAFDFDWSLRKYPIGTDDAPLSEPVKIDRNDLLILKEIRMDSNQRLADIAAKTGLTKSTVFWHWHEHVLGHGLVKGWRVNWLGTFRDPKTGEIAQRRSIVGFNILAKNLSSSEKMDLRAHLHALPYLWAEELGESDYFAELFLPIQSLMEGLDFLGKAIRPLVGKVKVLVNDQASARNFALHPDLFDEDEGWTYKGDLALQAIEKVVARSWDSRGNKKGVARE